ncbi:MAG: nitrite/sulfite reductase, partial [Actinomycetota bacterium]
HFGQKALRLPAKAAPEGVARVVRRFAAEREAGESFRLWLDRVGGAVAVAEGLKDLDHVPLPDDGPDFFVDYDETAPFVPEVSESECAT